VGIGQNGLKGTLGDAETVRVEGCVQKWVESGEVIHFHSLLLFYYKNEITPTIKH
jgi:hypothetical protein